MTLQRWQHSPLYADIRQQARQLRRRPNATRRADEETGAAPPPAADLSRLANRTAQAAAFDTGELTVEIALAYAAALLRDVPFTAIDSGRGSNRLGVSTSAIRDGLATLSRCAPKAPAPAHGYRRTRFAPRQRPLFRFGLDAVDAGPTVSQLLLQERPGGYARRVVDQQRSQPAAADRLSALSLWLAPARPARPAPDAAARRYLAAPRDLIALSTEGARPYLNTCTLLAAAGARVHAGCKPEPLRALLSDASARATQSLRDVGERCSPPEALGFVLTLLANRQTQLLDAEASADALAIYNELKPTGFLELINAHNVNHNLASGRSAGGPDADGHWRQQNLLLPIAAPAERLDGDPAALAAGVVAGVCVTLLKAGFRTVPDDDWTPLSLDACGFDRVFAIDDDPTRLRPAGISAAALSLHGELNKLAANVAAARSFAGVEYSVESEAALRLGERIAIGILCEQPGRYRRRLLSFDGDRITLDADGAGDLAHVDVTLADGDPCTYALWRDRPCR